MFKIGLRWSGPIVPSSYIVGNGHSLEDISQDFNKKKQKKIWITKPFAQILNFLEHSMQQALFYKKKQMFQSFIFAIFSHFLAQCMQFQKENTLHFMQACSRYLYV